MTSLVSLQRLHELKALAGAPDYQPDRQLAHTLIDHGISAAKALLGGDPAMKAAEDLRWRERELRAGLTFVHGLVSASNPNGEAALAVELMQEMVSARGAKFNRDWATYQARLEEEFNYPRKDAP